MDEFRDLIDRFKEKIDEQTSAGIHQNRYCDCPTCKINFPLIYKVSEIEKSDFSERNPHIFQHFQNRWKTFGMKSEWLGALGWPTTSEPEPEPVHESF